MKVQVAGFRLYAAQNRDEPCQALLLREINGRTQLFASYLDDWYQLSVSKANNMYGIGLLRSNTGLQNATAFAYEEEAISLLYTGREAVEYQKVRNHLIEITAVPLPPEAREIMFHGVSQDNTKRLVVVRSEYYPDNTRFYRAYLGSSFLSELPRLDFADDEPVRSVEDGKNRYVLPMASGKKLLVSPGGHVDSSYDGVDFTRSPSGIEIEEGISLLRIKLRIA